MDELKRKIGNITVIIDRSTCISSSNCIKAAPEVFKLDDERIVTFIDEIPETVSEDKIKEACSVCPVNVFQCYSE